MEYMLRYPATFIKDGRNILVTFNDVPEAITFGKNESEALEKAVEALETGLSFYVDSRKPLPKPSQMFRCRSSRFLMRFTIQNQSRPTSNIP